MKNTTKILIILAVAVVIYLLTIEINSMERDIVNFVPSKNQRLDSLERRMQEFDKFIQWQKSFNGAINDSLHIVK